jgi:hypothetical protein
VTAAANLVAGWGGLWEFAIPLLLLFAAIVVWLVWVATVWDWPRLPPYFAGLRRDRAWLQAPSTVIEESLRSGRFAPAIEYARYRTARVLLLRYGLRPSRLLAMGLSGEPVPAEARTLLGLHQTLTRAHTLADLAEGPLSDFWARWRQPARRERSLALFAAALPELERLLPPAEAGL